MWQNNITLTITYVFRCFIKTMILQIEPTTPPKKFLLPKSYTVHTALNDYTEHKKTKTSQSVSYW